MSHPAAAAAASSEQADAELLRRLAALAFERAAARRLPAADLPRGEEARHDAPPHRPGPDHRDLSFWKHVAPFYRLIQTNHRRPERSSPIIARARKTNEQEVPDDDPANVSATVRARGSRRSVNASSVLAQAKTFTVGVPLPLTGAEAKFGEMEKQAYEMAVEEINAKGGVKGDEARPRHPGLAAASPRPPRPSSRSSSR